MNGILDYILPKGWKDSKKVGFTDWSEINSDPEGFTVKKLLDYFRQYPFRSRFILSNIQDLHPM